jgi:ketosteroid isomerase-like protein
MRRMRLILLASALTAAACSSVPLNDPIADAKSLAEAESAFAAHSVREDMRTAFLAHFADDGVFVRGGAWTAARAWLGPRSAPPIVLDWRPVHVEAARSGELGLSTGPWKLAARAEPQVEKAHGQFVSVWRREPDGRWNVVVDIGISNPGASLWDAPLELVQPDSSQPNGSVEEAERAFAADAARDGPAGAYARHGSERLRLYRPGLAPAIGKSNALAALAFAADIRAWSVEASAASRSGDFAYARGRYGAAPRSGGFLRVWRSEAGAWRIVLDVADEAS